MRRFLRDLAAFGAIQATIAAGWWLAHRPFSEDYLAATVDKHARLERVLPPRLIVVGGSAAAFGFDCGAVAERLALAPVNMAVHFGLGATFMLREIRDDLRPGDVVLVALEYGHFASNARIGVLLDALGHRPASIRYVDWRLLRQLSDQALPYLATQLRIDLRRATGRLRPADSPYRRASFDEYGDVVEHWSQKPSRQNLDFVLGPVTHASIGGVSEAIGELAVLAESRGARVFFSYPPIPVDACDGFRDDLELIRSLSQRVSGVARLEKEGAGCYPRNLFYDTYYHLNRDGARRRTEEVIESLLSRGVARRQSSQ